VSPGANSPVLSALAQAERAARRLEAGERVDPDIIDRLLDEMKDLANAVLAIARDEPDIPARFARARKTLREHSTTRAQPAAFRFQGLVDLVTSEDRLRREQARLASEARASLTAADAQGAATKSGEALNLLDRRRGLVGDERQQIFFAKEGKELIAGFLDEHLRRRDWGAALELVERAKSRALLNQLGHSAIRKPAAPPSALTQKEEALLSAARETASAARANAMTQDGVRGFELWDRATRLQIELEEVWSALENDSAWAEYVSLRRGAALDLRGMRECLRDMKTRAALLSYYVNDSTTWLFVLGPDAPKPVGLDTGLPADHLRACAHRLLIDCNGVPAAFADIHSTEETATVEAALKLPPAARRLSRPFGRGPHRHKLLEPGYALTYLDELSVRLLPASIQPILDGCDVLCVSAHGPLHMLPLHALRLTDGAYVGQRFGVCSIPGIGVLRHCRVRNRARSTGLRHRLRTGLAACVDMLGEQSVNFAEDGKLLDPLRKGKRVLIGAEGRRAATKQRVIEQSERADVIHLSCHGVFAGDQGWNDPLRSALLLGDGRRPHIDGPSLRSTPDEYADCLLTARDIYSLQLNADLVTLGACSTGRAQVEAGDDLLGLSRAWLYAGTPSLILSLWNMNTRSSHRLLQVFYEEWLSAGEPKWRALKSAWKALLTDTANPEFRHPYHWAPFMLVGDWV
jgi:hypothetical protein